MLLSFVTVGESVGRESLLDAASLGRTRIRRFVSTDTGVKVDVVDGPGYKDKDDGETPAVRHSNNGRIAWDPKGKLASESLVSERQQHPSFLLDPDGGRNSTKTVLVGRDAILPCYVAFLGKRTVRTGFSSIVL
jgi:hypothetical protein